MNESSSEAGFSLVELVIVLAVMTVMTAIAIINLSSPRKYSADDQARKIVDFLDEARQKALNQKNTFRVEINKTKNQLTLIDENDNTTAADDQIIKFQPLSSQVVVGVQPSNVTSGPATTSPIPVSAYASSTYPLSSGEQKITMRFRLNGEVLDVGTDNTGTGSIATGATVFVTTAPTAAASPDVIRAVTVLGTSGDTGIYKCKFTSGVCGNWYK